MREADKCLDSQLWHACAGGMVQMPAIDSIVYYFPQGHAEHAQANVDFGSCPRIPALVCCRVDDIKFMADPETDEVFAKLRLVPLRPSEAETVDDDHGRGGVLGSSNGPPPATDFPEKLASFAKTLTQSDANNGGGFSVPRYCAETIFPRLDYSADPPVQTVLAKDVHGEVWKFRHIYRGTPRRHLLTTGWSTFVNQKKLVAGDSIVFLRTENGDLCVGIRRAKRGIGFGLESPSGWNPPAGNCMTPYGGFSVFLREEDSKLGRHGGTNGASANSTGGQRGRGRVKPESVAEAASLAANGQAFEVVYYPRASTPEFCVKASAVRAALRIQWCSGMRFKMAFETEDSSRISWFMGTISGVQVADPIRWPSSPWRLLQVTWDEPDLLQNVKRVSPWLVELVSNMPAIHISPFSPQRKKLRLSQNPDFPFDGQLPPPMFPGTPLGSSSNPLCFLSDSTPSGIQGARHSQFGISLSDLHINKLQSGLFQTGFHHLDHTAPMSRISTGLIVGSPAIHESVSCLLSIGNTSQNMKSACDAKTPNFVLFGKPILTEKQMALNASISPGTTRNDSDASAKQVVKIKAEGIGSTLSWHGSLDSSSNKSLCCKKILGEAGLDTGHCKVFMESEDVGRTLDLSVLCSYEEMYKKLVDMFGIAHSDMKGHVLYRDSTGKLKHAGDEPFGNFARTTRRLMILMDLESDKGSSETVKISF